MGRDTYWAPEVVRGDDGAFHMFVSVITGVPTTWERHTRRIEHHVSRDLVRWERRGALTLSSDRVIDACVARRDDGGWRMWFKDEARGSTTWAADAPGLDDPGAWTVVGEAVGGRPHEGPNVFRLGGTAWMLVDEWRGQAVHRSADLSTWRRQGLLLDRPGSRPDDAGVGLHADVHAPDPDGDEAWVVYFVHPGRTETWHDGDDGTDGTGGAEMDPGPMATPDQRRSSIQLARLRVDGGALLCDRDEPARLPPPRAS